MNTINELVFLNETLTRSLNEKKVILDEKYTECENNFNLEVRRFIEEKLSPAFQIPAESIFIWVDEYRIRFSTYEERWGGNHICKNNYWDNKDVYYELSWYSTSVSEKKPEYLQQQLLNLQLLGMIAKEFNSKSYLFIELIGLQNKQKEVMQPYHALESEYNTIKYAIESNQNQIVQIKIDEYLITGKRYDLTVSEPLWLNEKDHEYPDAYIISKFTAKKIFFTYFHTRYGKEFEYTGQTTISNFRYFIQNVIKKIEDKASKKEEEVIAD